MSERLGPIAYLRQLLLEGIATARSQPIVTTMTALVISAVCAVILGTVGQAAAAEAHILSTVDDAGTRTIIVSDPAGRAGLRADSLASVQALSDVTWVVGLGPVTDVSNTALRDAGLPVSARRIYGDWPSELRLAMGRMPAPGEAIAGERAFRLLGAVEPAVGARSDTLDAPIVGTFAVDDPLTFLDSSILVRAGSKDRGDDELRELVVVASRADRVAALGEALAAVVHATDRTELRIATPVQLAQLRTLIEKELAMNSRQQLLVVLAVGLIVITVTLFGAVAQRRRDFGRRRALGATRSALVLLVIVQSLVAAAFGVVLGSVVGVIAVDQLVGFVPSWDFIFGVATLAALTAILAAIPPGLSAAYRDPVRILRVP
jgi:putative ABC transport system permease protein